MKAVVTPLEAKPRRQKDGAEREMPRTTAESPTARNPLLHLQNLNLQTAYSSITHLATP
ncbi:MAG: hypothetical protein LM566_00870 [Pyrobaculum sp.]|nr:hypothetical protein [Pyrobaculum sp.]